MKKITIITIIAFVSFTIISCVDDLKNKAPLGALNPDVLANADGVDLLLTGAYGLLDGYLNNGNDAWTQTGTNWTFGDVCSDDAHKGSTPDDQADLQKLEGYTWETANNFVLQRWLAIYGGISRCNDVINLANTADIDETFKAQKIGEARFLRAHYHFDAKRMWGNIPYITEENLDNPNIPNKEEVWGKIETDFQYAVDNLPDLAATEVGRANVWAAKAYLGKVLLYQHKYGEALIILKDVIDNGPYVLSANFKDNFTFAGKNSSESVFAIQFSTGDVNGNVNGNFGTSLNHINGGPMGTCCGFFQPSQTLVNAFQTDTNGLPLLETFNDSDIVNDDGITSDESFTPHAGTLDPRLDHTVGRRGIEFLGWGIMPGADWVRSPVSGGPYLARKSTFSVEEEGDAGGRGGWGQVMSALNYDIIRYADVLLMAAEAAVENGELELARTYTNMVRDRALNSETVKDGSGNDAANYLVAPYEDTWTDQDIARMAVRMERRLELALEGHRLYDLRRWGIAETVIDAFIAKEGALRPNLNGADYQSKHDLFPIPLNAIDISNNVLTQNDGY